MGIPETEANIKNKISWGIHRCLLRPMPRSDWLRNAAFVGCLIAALSVGDSLAQNDQPAPSAETQSTEQKAADSSANPIALNLTVNPTVQEVPCDDACKADKQRQADHDRDDLAAQQVMAKYARFMTWLTVAQIVVGLGTIGFLAATFRQNKKIVEAALASSSHADRTADATENAVIFSQQNFEKSERPRVFVNVESFIGDRDPHHAWVDFTIWNMGRVAGIVHSYACGVREFSIGIPRTPDGLFGAPKPTNHIVGVNDSFSIPNQNLVLDEHRDSPAITEITIGAFFFVSYSDGSGVIYTDRFGFRYDREAHVFTQIADPHWTRREREDETGVA